MLTMRNQAPAPHECEGCKGHSPETNYSLKWCRTQNKPITELKTDKCPHRDGTE